MNSRSCCGASARRVGSAAEALVAHQIDEVAAERLQTVLHAIEQFGIVRFGRQVHRQVDDFRMASDRAMAALGADAHEGALPHARLDQAALLRLDIAAGDGGEIDIEPARELALRRQAIGRLKPPVANALGDGVGDGEVTRLVALGEVRPPVPHINKAPRYQRLGRLRAGPAVGRGICATLKLTVHCCAGARYAKCACFDSRFADAWRANRAPRVMPRNWASRCLFFAVHSLSVGVRREQY